MRDDSIVRETIEIVPVPLRLVRLVTHTVNRAIALPGEIRTEARKRATRARREAARRLRGLAERVEGRGVSG